jgi:[ribosomal protein S5]-alanine N-acetyltransferase
MTTIHADRLDLVIMSPAFLRASLEHDTRAAEAELGLPLPEGWPGESSDVVSLRLEQLKKDPTLGPWLLRAMVLRATREMVGYIGFHTAPGADYLRPFSPTGVEFGYTVFPGFRRQGYAREACRALMLWASEHHGVANFVLSISPENHPSQALAAQLGFTRIGTHMDEVDGFEDVLECRRHR